jgi:hypothetical protein
LVLALSVDADGQRSASLAPSPLLEVTDDLLVGGLRARAEGLESPFQLGGRAPASPANGVGGQEEFDASRVSALGGFNREEFTNKVSAIIS